MRFSLLLLPKIAAIWRDRAFYNQLRHYLGRHKAAVSLLLLLQLLAQSLVILVPISLARFLELLFDYHSRRSEILNVLPPGWFDTTLHFISYFLILVLLRSVISWCSMQLRDWLSLRFVWQLQDRLFSLHLALPLSVYEKSGTGKYLLRWSGDLKSVRNWLSKGVFQLLTDGMLLFLAAVMMWQLIPWPLLTLLGFGLVSAGVVRGINLKLYRAGIRSRNQRSGLLKYVSRQLQTMRTLQAFNRQGPTQKRFQKRLEAAFGASTQYAAWQNLIYSLAPALLFLFFLVVLWQMHYVSADNQGSVLTIFLLLLSLQSAFRRVLCAGLYWKNGEISLEKLFALFGAAPPAARSQKNYRFVCGDVRIRQTSSPGTNPALPDFHAPGPGMYLLPVSSHDEGLYLVRVMLGLTRSAGTKVLLDEQSISHLAPYSVRRRMSVIGGDFPLTGESAFEAISYSKKAKKRAPAARLLSQIQRGLPRTQRISLDDPIGEGSSLLSHQQQAILQVARALLTHKPILLILGVLPDLHPKVRKNVEELLDQRAVSTTILVLELPTQHTSTPGARVIAWQTPAALKRLKSSPGD